MGKWFGKKEDGALKRLLTVMLKIGLIGFGGGTALIPVIEEEAVERNHLVDENEFNKDVIVANITPGALPVEIAANIGRSALGIPGMLLAATCMALPGALLTVFIVALIYESAEMVLWQIMFASVGVTAYIIFMLGDYAKGTYRECRINRNAKSGMFFMLIVFWVTSGKENTGFTPMLPDNPQMERPIIRSCKIPLIQLLEITCALPTQSI